MKNIVSFDGTVVVLGIIVVVVDVLKSIVSLKLKVISSLIRSKLAIELHSGTAHDRCR